MDQEKQSPLRHLELPRRWERLEQDARAAQVDPAAMVERVDDAANRVDALLRRVRGGGVGLIEVLFGLSGSGKTTFLQTLEKFFVGIRVSVFPKNAPLGTLPHFIQNDAIPQNNNNRIVLIDRRDNPTQNDLSLVEEMFGELLNIFRESNGNVVVLWPITNEISATFVSETAWKVGRDSMVDPNHRGLFHFLGVPKEKYWDLADNTSRTLTGDGLEAYGIIKSQTVNFIPKCDTISDFYGMIMDLAEQQRENTWSVLKVRAIPRLWVLLPGDDVKSINATADALTQGIQSKIDVDKVGELIDTPDQDTIYIRDWRSRRGLLAHLLRAIDVRLFSIPPNVSLAAIRSFGDENIKEKLKQPTAILSASKATLRASRLYKSILREANIETEPYAGARRISKETVDEYLRIQSIASKDDKSLNKAFGGLIAACLAEDAPHVTVTMEKKSLPGSTLQPDIQIEIRHGEYICLEPTWRTSGSGIVGEINPAQNTLTEAHIRKYVLEKATQYVKDIGL